MLEKFLFRNAESLRMGDTLHLFVVEFGIFEQDFQSIPLTVHTYNLLQLQPFENLPFLNNFETVKLLTIPRWFRRKESFMLY